MQIVLFDTIERSKLFPLTLTKAIADIRMGIMTIRERWEKITGLNTFVLTDEYLQCLYDDIEAGDYYFISASVLPNQSLVEKILQLNLEEGIKDDNGLIAARAMIQHRPTLHSVELVSKNLSSVGEVKRLSFPFELFQWNQAMIEFDFELVTNGRTSESVHSSVQKSRASNIFIEEGAEINHSILNAGTGSIYIGRNATIMEGCTIRGPFSLGEGAVLKMGTKIYGATTIGPYCMGGGEIKNSILSGYSNKAHEGYLGDSVIGEWCNMGAGTSNSNLKNTGGIVNLWNYASKQYLPAGNKCGVIMGDYSRTAINSSINTGSVIGVSSNVFGAGLLPKLIPDFVWGSTVDSKYQFDKAIQDIQNWKKMKNKTLSQQETNVLKHIFEQFDN